jgi:Tol biopolymer transport system component
MRGNRLTRAAVGLAVASATSIGLLSTPAHAAWPGSNGKIIYTKDHNGTDEEIYSINADGTGATPLTNNTNRDEAPSVSADGTKIAFIRYTGGSGEIFTMNIDGSNQTRLTNTGVDELDVSWSPDASKLYYARAGNQDSEIYSMNADGTGATQLTNNSTRDDEPVVSPDGTKVMFERKSATTHHYDLWTMNPDGTGAAKLFDCADTKECLSPDYSPDGTRITYTRWNWNVNPVVSRIHVANADGTNRMPISPDGNYYNYSAFSPDGTYVMWGGGPSDDLWRYNLNTQGLFRLMNDGPDEWGPDWAHA